MNKVEMMVLAAAAVQLAFGVELVVAPGGMTPAAAQLEARRILNERPGSPVTVRVRAGTYYLSEPLAFTAADSGTPMAPVVWLGEPGAVLSAGRRVVGWAVEADGSWSAPIPEDSRGKPIYAEQLWVNGHRAARSRLPRTGWLSPSGASSEKVKGRNWYLERFAITNAEVRAALAAVPAEEWPYAQLVVNRKWSCARRVLFGYEAATGSLLMHSALPQSGWQGWSTVAVGALENVRSAFANPGDWFYDARDRKIRYRPLPGESLASLEAVASVAGRTRALDFRGNCDAGEYVHDLEFRNLTFAHTAITPAEPAPGRAPFDETEALAGAPKGATQAYQWQAAIGSDGAVAGEGAVRVAFDGCRFEHTGNYGLALTDGCVSNRIVGCAMSDLGAGGVKIGSRFAHSPDRKPISRRVIVGLAPRSTAFNVVSNCTIRHTGQINLEGVGVLMTHCSDSKILNCVLEHLSYSGISVGWVWGYAGSVSQRNEIAYNRIGFVGNGVTSDMGGVYLLGTAYGTRVHHNIVHDVDSREYGGYGLYCDEGSEGVTMENNVVWNTTSAGFFMHYGVDNYIRNNIFAWNRLHGSVRMYRPLVNGVPSSLHFVNNIILTRQAQLVDDLVSTVGGVWANNLWWDGRGPAAASFDGMNWEKWTKCGKESRGRLADPRFVDAEHFDFRLKSDSPALALGFNPEAMPQRQRICR